MNGRLLIKGFHGFGFTSILFWLACCFRLVCLPWFSHFACDKTPLTVQVVGSSVPNRIKIHGWAYWIGKRPTVNINFRWFGIHLVSSWFYPCEIEHNHFFRTCYGEWSRLKRKHSLLWSGWSSSGRPHRSTMAQWRCHFPRSLECWPTCYWTAQINYIDFIL